MKIEPAKTSNLQPSRRIALTATLMVIAWVLLPSTLEAQSIEFQDIEPPRPYSAAERAAAELAAQYLADGPEAWLDDLDAKSRLKQMPRAQALRELELQAAPAAGAEWTLQTPHSPRNTAVIHVRMPSGLEDILTLQLRQRGDQWRLQSVTSASLAKEPAASERNAGSEDGMDARDNENAANEDTGGEDATAGSDLTATTEGTTLRQRLRQAHKWAAVLLALAAGLFSVARSESRWALLAAAGSAFSVVLSLAAFAGWWLVGRSEPAPVLGNEGLLSAEQAAPEDLIKLRRLLASGDLQGAEALSSSVDGPWSAATVWRTQMALAQHQPDRAEHILSGLAHQEDTPMISWLRGRIKFELQDEIGAALAFEAAVRGGLRHDGLLHEAAMTFELLNYPEQALQYFDELTLLGSRDSEAQYYMSRKALLEGLRTRSLQHFVSAWRLQPILRQDLLRDFILSYLVTDTPELLKEIDLASADEPLVACQDLAADALTLPKETISRMVGQRLEIEAGTGRLIVPGGCKLAPEDTRIYDSGAWQRLQDSQRMADLPRLIEAQASGTLHPGWQQRLAEAADTLQRQERWQELEDLTRGVDDNVDATDPAIVRRRAFALQKLGRKAEASSLLVALAKVGRAHRRNDPATLYQLAEILVKEQEYDLAQRLIIRADSQLPFEADGQRALQVQMEKRLFSSHLEENSTYFRILYPSARPWQFARRILQILEAERSRLQQWIPLDSEAVTDVLLLDFADFQSSYGGMDIVGLFDGRIRVPFGQVVNFNPWVVSILSHELAHAMITEATDDRAPRWLQEGLAQHIEMSPDGGINPIAEYHRTHSLLSLPMIEGVLDGFAAQPLIPIAYDQACWALHFIESRYGKEGIHRLLDAYRRGGTTEEVFQEVFDRSPVEFDQAMQRWWLEEAPQTWNLEVIEYGDDS